MKLDFSEIPLGEYSLSVTVNGSRMGDQDQKRAYVYAELNEGKRQDVYLVGFQEWTRSVGGVKWRLVHEMGGVEKKETAIKEKKKERIQEVPPRNPCLQRPFGR